MSLIQVEPKKIHPTLKLSVWQEFAKSIVAGGSQDSSVAVARQADQLTAEYEKRWLESVA